jgi:hypothetical protein
VDAEAATKKYVDDNAVASLLQVYEYAYLIDANVTLSGEQTPDGTLTSTSRVWLVNQTDASENGGYVTAAGAWARVAELDSDADLAAWKAQEIHARIGSTGTEYGLGGLGGLKYRIAPNEGATTLDTDDLEIRPLPGIYPIYYDDMSADTAAVSLANIPPIQNADLVGTLNGLSGAASSGTEDTLLLYLQGEGAADDASYVSTRHYAGTTHADADLGPPVVAYIRTNIGTDGLHDGAANFLIQDYAHTGNKVIFSRDSLYQNTNHYANDYTVWRHVNEAVDEIRLITGLELATPGANEIEAGTRVEISIRVRR